MHVTADTVTNPGYQHTHILYSRVPSITGGIKMTATLPPSGLQVSLYQSFLFLSLFRCVCVCVFMLKKCLWEEIDSVSKQFSNMKGFSDWQKTHLRICNFLILSSTSVTARASPRPAGLVNYNRHHWHSLCVCPLSLFKCHDIKCLKILLDKSSSLFLVQATWRNKKKNRQRVHRSKAFLKKWD